MAGNVKEEHYKIVYDTGGVVKPEGDEEMRDNSPRKPAPGAMYKKGGEIEDIDEKINKLKEQKRVASLSDEERVEHEEELSKHEDVKTYRTSEDYSEPGHQYKTEIPINVKWDELSYKEKKELKKKHPNLDVRWDKSIIEDTEANYSQIKKIKEQGFKYGGDKSNPRISVKESTVSKDIKDDKDKIISKLISKTETGGKDHIRIYYPDLHMDAPRIDGDLEETDPDEYKRQVQARKDYYAEHPSKEYGVDQEQSTYRQRNFPLGFESHRKVFSKRNKDGELEYYQDWDFESFPKKVLQEIAAVFGNYSFLEDKPKKISKKKFERVSKRIGKRHSKHVEKTDIEGAPHNRTGKTRTKMVKDWDLGGKKEIVQYELIDEEGNKYWTSDLYRPDGSPAESDADEDNIWKRKEKEEDIEDIKKHTKKRMGGQIGFSYKNQRYQKPKGDNYASSDRASQGESFSNDVAGMGE